MVRWNDEDTVIDNNTSIEVVQAPQSVEARNLFHFAKINAWDELIGCLSNYSADTMLHACDQANGYENASLLHVVLSSEEVPLRVVREILDSSCNPTSMVSDTNAMKQTPLHIAIHFIPERTEIIECLVRVAPAIISFRDHLNLRPIDILLQKVQICL